jgi:hypothetical protein
MAIMKIINMVIVPDRRMATVGTMRVAMIAKSRVPFGTPNGVFPDLIIRAQVEAAVFLSFPAFSETANVPDRPT